MLDSQFQVGYTGFSSSLTKEGQPQLLRSSMSTIHNPSQFDPANYVVEDYFDNVPPVFAGGSVEYFEREVAWWKTAMAQAFGPDYFKKIHKCAHCGNTLVRWITAVRHLPTDEVLVFGAVCTGRLGFPDKQAFKLARLKSAAETRSARLAVYLKCQSFLKKNPEVAQAVGVIDDAVHARNGFARDVISKLHKYGDLSAKQVSALLESLARDVEYAARKAAEAEEVKGDAPSGRADVTGVIVGLKWVESEFGRTQKMIVKLENNSKVYVTVPSKESVERGDTVTFRATFEVSKDDKSFAFGKRPMLINRVAAQ